VREYPNPETASRLPARHPLNPRRRVARNAGERARGFTVLQTELALVNAQGENLRSQLLYKGV